MINIISIESYKFLFWHGKKFEITIVIFLWKTDKLKSKISNLVCVNTHKISKSWIFLSVFHRNISILISNICPCQNRNLWLSNDILITYEYFLILAAGLAKIKFSKSTEKLTLRNVLNFTSLYSNKIEKKIIMYTDHLLSNVRRTFPSKFHTYTFPSLQPPKISQIKFFINYY